MFVDYCLLVVGCWCLLVDVCCLLSVVCVVVRCLLLGLSGMCCWCGVCGFLFVDGCSLFVVWCVWWLVFVIVFLLVVVGWLGLFAVRCVLCVDCRLPFGVCSVLLVVCCFVSVRCVCLLRIRCALFVV